MGNKIAHALIGNTAKRGTWIGQTDGKLPTYEGPIPVAEVERRLFNWEAISVPTGNFIPCEPDSIGSIMIDGNYYMPKVTTGRQGIVRSDDFSELGRPTTAYAMHDYKVWLIRKVSEMLGSTLSILSALTLKNGAQAAVEIGLDDTMHDDTTGLDFWPFLLAKTSLDGSITTTYEAFNRVLRCDNMFGGISRDAKNAGRQFKVKHTARSLETSHVAGFREAMVILDQSAHDMQDWIQTMSGIQVPRKNWLQVLDIIEPPAPAGSTAVKVTKTNNRRELLDSIYLGQGELGELNGPFAGTAFGVVQASNTYQHHGVGVRGTSRLERVYDRAIRGDLAASDQIAVEALAKVLDMPELAMA
ncbi:DUF932 domain-containing protein [Mycobacterium sp. AZCC_0083]|uniref:DUF932 domain-containing protein n=1 Tax=Mycobacterium sp. AZCC_0083 TaxID=2735882 RepID=UPI0016125E6B|nr:DUF932 domain-containing protein [Mycobacterium sp. AZCC_0083]MBB5167086.1 hypothetical protein [Mycobacterium sp. AZCC_0083]